MMTDNAKASGSMSSINFRVDSELRDRVDRVAARSGLTVSQLSRLAVERLVASLDDTAVSGIVVPLRVVLDAGAVESDEAPAVAATG